MRILAVTHVFPWPADNGARIRAANVVRALSRVGDVDLFTILSTQEARELGDTGERAKLAQETAVRLGAAPRPSSSYSLRRRLGWITASSLPYEVGTRDHSAIRTAFATWAQPPYDLIWMEHAESFVSLEPLIDAPCIVDLDDLEDHKVRARLAARRYDWGRRAWWTRLDPNALAKHWGSLMQAGIESRRWQKLQQRIASSVGTVTVCSPLDLARLGVRNAAVVPNGYHATSLPLGRIAVGQPPTLLLAGALTYTPNADAARYLVRDILPRIRKRVPNVQVRLVGRYDGRAEVLRGEGVALTGYVRDIRTELAQADVVVVPMRFGSGTRIKILEAFAHRIPVVSTSLGSEGLDVIGGRHALISDDPDGFAADCVRLVTDPRLRESLVAAAFALFSERYRWESISSTICELARRAAMGDRRHSPIRPYGGASPNQPASSGRISASEGADRSR